MTVMTQNEAVMRLRQILNQPGLTHWQELLDIVAQHPFLVEYADSHIVESWPHTLRRLNHVEHPGLPLVRLLDLKITEKNEQDIKETLLHPTLLSNLTMLQLEVSSTNLNWVHVLSQTTALQKLTHLLLKVGTLQQETMELLWESGLLEGLRYLSLRGVHPSWYQRIEDWGRQNHCQLSLSSYPNIRWN